MEKNNGLKESRCSPKKFLTYSHGDIQERCFLGDSDLRDFIIGSELFMFILRVEHI